MDLILKLTRRKSCYIKRNAEPPPRAININSIIRRRILSIGLWYGSSSRNIHWIAKVSIFSFVLNVSTQLISVFMNKGDREKLFASFSILSFCFMGFLKLWSLLANQKYWSCLFNQASALESEQLNDHDYTYDYESDNEEDSNFSDHISSYTKRFSSISTHLTRVYYFTVIVYMASPFIEYGFLSYEGEHTMELPHILPGWSPLDTNVLGYAVTILVEVVTSIYCVKVHIVFDLSVISIMIFMCGQFTLLRNYSECIAGQGESGNLSNRRDNRAHFRIKKCHHIHVLLLKSANELGLLIQNILGIYFFLATLTLCSVAAQLKWEKLSTPQLISLLQYMGATLTQLFLFCYYGDAVFNESTIGPGEGPFCAAYWCLSSKIRREIALLGVGISRPCKILAGPFNSLDLPSFIQVVRAAYSYYAFIRQTPK